MAISNDLVSKLVNAMKEEPTKNNVTGPLYGTIVGSSGSNYVQLDGSSSLTPMVSTVDYKAGERVLVTISNHTATVLGNVSSPAARTDRVEEVASNVIEVSRLVAEKATIKDLEAETARIDSLVADNIVVKDKISASEAEIANIKADNVTIKGNLDAASANITKLQTEKLDATAADIKYATIDSLDVTNANINNLKATYGDFVNLTTDKFTAVDASIKNLEADNVTINGKLTANDASIKNLEATKATVEDLNATKARIDTLDSSLIRVDDLIAKKADIDLANVNNAWIQNGIIKDGSIGSAAIHDGAITNVKIADATIEAAKIKSINADTITAGTIKTDRLIITGPDGQDSIVKAINIANGVSEAEVNSKQLQAASIDVVDLSAFKAKIADFDLSGNAIYSNKTSIKDPSSGIYISTTGIGMGDGSLTGKDESPLQAYADGSFRLVGKNSSFDFNTVTGELNIEATNLNISSKKVATTDDVDNMREEISTVMAISSTRGTSFKNNAVSTELYITIYHGKDRITDAATMKKVYGESAYIQWKWLRLTDESFGVISSADSRFRDDGFRFILSPDDVDAQVVFECELIVDDQIYTS